MKRRSFLKQAAAFASAPALPIKARATPLPVSAEAYAKATHWAGLWVHSTAATYSNVLGVNKQVGEAVFKRLQADGILGRTDAIGVARAVTPYYEIPQVAARLKKTMAKPPLSPKSSRPPKTIRKTAEALSKADNEATEGLREDPSDALTTAKRPVPRPHQNC